MKISYSVLFMSIIFLFLISCSSPLEEADQQREVEQELIEESEQSLVKVNTADVNNQFYVPSEQDNIISVIDMPSNQVSGEITTGERPANIVFIEQKDKAFVTHRNGNSVGVIDLKRQKMIKEIKVGNDPHALALNHDKTKIYVTTVGDQYVYVIDTEKEEVSRKIDLGSGARTNYPYLYGDYLYITDHKNHLVYEVKDDNIIKTYRVSGPPMVSRTNADGTLLYVASSDYNALEVYDTETGEKVDEIKSGKDVTDFVINRDESHLVATNKDGNSVSIIDLTSKKIVGKIEDLAAPKHISFNKDESMVYFSLSGTNKVAVVDISSMGLVDEIEVGRSPHGVQLR